MKVISQMRSVQSNSPAFLCGLRLLTEWNFTLLNRESLLNSRKCQLLLRKCSLLDVMRNSLTEWRLTFKGEKSGGGTCGFKFMSGFKFISRFILNPLFIMNLKKKFHSKIYIRMDLLLIRLFYSLRKKKKRKHFC